MANKRVDQLDDIDALAGADSFPVRDASATSELKEVTATQVAAFIDAAGAAAAAISTHAALTSGVHGISTFGASLVDDADAAAARTTLGLGNASTLTVDADLATLSLPAKTTISTFGASLVDDADAAAGRTTLGAEAAGAAAAAQAAAVQRANHTGTQTASTISDFSTAVAATAAVTANTAKVTNATHTGDVTGATALTIANDAVTNAKLANMDTARIKGRVAAGSGDPEDLTASEVRTLLNVEDGADVTDAANVEAALEAATLSSVTGATGDEFLIIDATDGGLKAVLFQDLPGAGGGLSNIVEDTTPQLGGMLDVNGQAIGDGTRELVTFVEDASAVNHLEVENQATGSGPILRAVGDDTNVDLNLSSKGTGVVAITGAVTVSSTVDGRDLATDGSKLDGIEALADVTDATNVEAAGALMDSEVDADIKTLSLPANTTISTFGASLVDDADAAAGRTTLGLGDISTQASSSVTITGGSVTGITDLAIADGGTGASTAAAAASNLQPLNTVGASGSTETLLMGVNDVTMDQACTFTFPTVGAGAHEFTLILRGAFTPTFPASVDWPSATAPTYATPTEFSFRTVDSGTTWLGVAAPGFG